MKRTLSSAFIASFVLACSTRGGGAGVGGAATTSDDTTRRPDTSGKHILLVDMNRDFNYATMISPDGCHPNTTGYKFMANQWYATIGSRLPK